MTEILTIQILAGTTLLGALWIIILAIRNYQLSRQNSEIRTTLRLGIALKYNAKFVNWLIYERGL